MRADSLSRRKQRGARPSAPGVRAVQLQFVALLEAITPKRGPAIMASAGSRRLPSAPAKTAPKPRASSTLRKAGATSARATTGNPACRAAWIRRRWSTSIQRPNRPAHMGGCSCVTPWRERVPGRQGARLAGDRRPGNTRMAQTRQRRCVCQYVRLARFVCFRSFCAGRCWTYAGAFVEFRQ